MSNSVAIVTGASQGIGRATAIRLARDFSSLVLIARDEAHLQETAQKAKTFGAESLELPLDLREPAFADKIVNEALSRFGRIDAVVNIAGAVPQIDLLEMTDSQWDDGMALKFHGARRLTIRAWDALKASRGSVVYGPEPLEKPADGNLLVCCSQPCHRFVKNSPDSILRWGRSDRPPRLRA